MVQGTGLYQDGRQGMHIVVLYLQPCACLQAFIAQGQSGNRCPPSSCRPSPSFQLLSQLARLVQGVVAVDGWPARPPLDRLAGADWRSDTRRWLRSRIEAASGTDDDRFRAETVREACLPSSFTSIGRSVAHCTVPRIHLAARRGKPARCSKMQVVSHLNRGDLREMGASNAQ